MQKPIPLGTIQALARSIYKEDSSYGFGQLDIIRLVNELMDSCSTLEQNTVAHHTGSERLIDLVGKSTSLPLFGERLKIRAFGSKSDMDILKAWLPDKYGRYFVLSSTSAQSVSLDELVGGARNHLGMITTPEGKPIGALAYLNHDVDQRRAELRKLIGDPEFRGMGIAEEATRLWVHYGFETLGLEKIYVSTLQTHIGNIKLNEKIGFQVEGLLRDEVLIEGRRCDILRMGICKD